MAEKFVDLDEPLGKPGYGIHFNRHGKNIVMTCTEHGVFYDKPKPLNTVGQNNVVRAQERQHRMEFHNGEPA